MNVRVLALGATLLALPGMVFAQALTRDTQIQLASGEVTTLGEFCDDSENTDDEACIALIAGADLPITNFAPIAAAGGIAAILGAAAGGGGGTPTTTTPVTTTPNTN